MKLKIRLAAVAATIALGAPLAAADPSTFYAGGARGYVDYPPLDAPAAREEAVA